MEHRIWGEECRTTLMCVDCYDHGVLAGRLYNACRKEGWFFRSLMEFLKQMEELLDEVKCPQPFAERRLFERSGKVAAQTAPDEEPKTGHLATFSVRVMFRQNASWQGSLTWLEKGSEQSFRSVLELIMLIHSVLGREADHKKDA